MAGLHMDYKRFKHLSMGLCAALVAIVFFFLIRPLEAQNDDMKQEIVRAEATLRNIREAQDRHAALSLRLEKLRVLVVRIVAESFRSPPLYSVHNDLGRLLSVNGIRIMAVEKSERGGDSAADGFFARHRSMWKLRGGFRNYIAFKEALTAYREAAIHIDEEKLSKGKDDVLNIEIRLSAYQFESA